MLINTILYNLFKPLDCGLSWMQQFINWQLFSNTEDYRYLYNGPHRLAHVSFPFSLPSLCVIASL